MKVGLFGRPSLAPLASCAKGLEALGYRVVWQAPQVWTEDQWQPFDLVVTSSLRMHGKRIADHYRHERKTPVLAVDLPPIRREGYWALWHGNLNELPDEAPPDRLEMVEFGESKPGDKVLVCGQKPADAAHEMSAEEMAEYFGSTVAMLKSKHPEARIVWRPHPKYQSLDFSVERSEEATIEEALEGAAAVVTYNSTSGIAAILAGVPTFSAPQSFYRELSGEGLPELGGRDRVPTEEEKLQFFSRLTHVCWTEDELSTAEPWRETLGRVA